MVINVKNNSMWKRIFLFLVLLAQICCIFQSCGSNKDCPTNSFCGYRNYCVCNQGFIMNCSLTAQNTSTNPVSAVVSNSYSYFIIQPEILYEYIKFSIKLSTNETTTGPLIVTLWGQTGYLSELVSNNQMQTLGLQISSSSEQTIDTTYFQFGLQPNGQPQVIYIGLKLNTTTANNYCINITVNQQSAYNQNTLKVILTILMSILSIVGFVLIAFCFYRRRRMNQMRQRATQQKQVKSTQHFDQYMPKVPADRVKVPLQVCSVCLNDIVVENFVRLTICKHLFHADCIDSWCKKNPICPICRQQLDLQSCQKILGQNFDLSQVTNTKRLDEENVQIELMQRNQNQNIEHQHNQEEIIQDNSMRRAML